MLDFRNLPTDDDRKNVYFVDPDATPADVWQIVALDELSLSR